MARYALGVAGGVDTLALTNVDRLVGLDGLKAANAYPQCAHFPNGAIRFAPPDRESAVLRTNALFQVRPDYQPLPLVPNDSPANKARNRRIEIVAR